MTTEQTEAPEWGAPTPPPPNRTRWTVKRVVVAVAIAVGIAGAGGAAIYAASGSVDQSQGPGGRGGGMIVGGPMGTMEGIDHGEFQNGEITAISDTSVTVKSKDGFTKTYKVDGDTEKAGEVKKGAEVVVIVNGEGTAESIRPVDMMGPRRGGGATPNRQPPNSGGPNGN